MSSLKKFSDYIKNKEIDILKNDIAIDIYVGTKVYQYEKLGETIKVAKQQKQLKKAEKEQEF